MYVRHPLLCVSTLSVGVCVCAYESKKGCISECLFVCQVGSGLPTLLDHLTPSTCSLCHLPDTGRQ